MNRRSLLHSVTGSLTGSLMGSIANTLIGTLLAGPHRSAQAQPNGELDVPYVTTPQNVVDAMLELAQVGPGDRLLDLGSGDGRIVITAARRFGISGLGIEIDPSLVELSRKNAISQGVAERARFVVDDLMTTDLSRFNVITMYLLPDVNLLLRPKLRSLPAGTRIVSHDWDMGDWLPERTVEVVAPDKQVGLRKVSRLMRWTV
ncbi:MAG: methyltransferase domain-containing protein [Burkholderiales bacterium]